MSNSNSHDIDIDTDTDIRPVSFAVVSTAEIARNKVIPALLSVPSTVLVAVSSRNKDRAQAFVDEHCGGGESDEGDDDDARCKGMTHEEILSEDADPLAPAIDAVYVPLPSRVRNEFLVRALERGKHVYSEKPHGGTVNEFKAVLDLAASKNLQWMDGTMWYHSHRTKAMEQRLFGSGGEPSSSSPSSSSPSLGRVRRVTASFTWGGGGLVDEAWKEGGNGRTDPSREPMGMLGDSGHYPVSAVAWAFGWKLPERVRVFHCKRNTVGAIIDLDAVLWFGDGGRAVIDTSCELPHRSQFEVVCDNGVLKVDDLVGGQGRTGNFGAYEGPFVGSSSFVVGDHLGRDATVGVEPCDHVRCLVRAFGDRVRTIRDDGGKADPEWSKRSLCTHTILSAIFESAMRGGVDVELVAASSSPSNDSDSDSDSDSTHYIIEGQRFEDIPTRDWNKTEEA